MEKKGINRKGRGRKRVIGIAGQIVNFIHVLVICDPPCSNGACVPGNQCSCPQGFSDPRCSTPEVEDCGDIINPCVSNESCLLQAGSYQCEGTQFKALNLNM